MAKKQFKPTALENIKSGYNPVITHSKNGYQQTFNIELDDSPNENNISKIIDKAFNKLKPEFENEQQVRDFIHTVVINWGLWTTSNPNNEVRDIFVKVKKAGRYYANIDQQYINSMKQTMSKHFRGAYKASKVFVENLAKAEAQKATETGDGPQTFINPDSPTIQKKVQAIVAANATKADKIRALDKMDLTPRQIADLLPDCKVTHVRNVLRRDRKKETPSL